MRFWSTIRRPDAPLATRLTQNNKREAKGVQAQIPNKRVPPQPNICADCGKLIAREFKHCRDCALKNSTAFLIAGAQSGRVAAQSFRARTHRKESKRRHDLARHNWSPSDQPSWLTEETYVKQILPKLKTVTLSELLLRLVSRFRTRPTFEKASIDRIHVTGRSLHS